MSNRILRLASRGAVVLALIAVAGCSSAQPTPIVVIVTPSPAPTELATPTPAPTPVATPTPAATPTDTPPAASATPVASATPAATSSSAPGSSFPPAPATTPGPASACTGSSDPVHGAAYIAFWTASANVLPFTVFCGILPGGWFFNGSVYTQPNHGHLGAKYSYKTGSGPSIQLDEGGDATQFTSVTLGSALGFAYFGDLTGTLYAGPSGAFVLQVAPGTAHAYQAIGTGVSKATFVNVVGALMKVAKV